MSNAGGSSARPPPGPSGEALSLVIRVVPFVRGQPRPAESSSALGQAVSPATSGRIPVPVARQEPTGHTAPGYCSAMPTPLADLGPQLANIRSFWLGYGVEDRADDDL